MPPDPEVAMPACSLGEGTSAERSGFFVAALG